MYDTSSTFLQSELNYRQGRIKAGTAGSRRRSGRITRVRRGAGSTSADTTR